MEEDADKIIKEDKQFNIRIFPSYKMLSWDLLFYYSIIFLYLTQVKHLSAAQVILGETLYNVVLLVFQLPAGKIVDTIGMSTLFLPDLQYHFHDVNPNEVVNHAYNVLSYIFDEDNPIKNGDTIDGLINGQMSQEVQWTVQYEDSLIQPVRTVIDINMGEYASGNR